MSILKNRVFATAAALILVASAIFFGGWRSLRAERARIEALCTKGDLYTPALSALIEGRKRGAAWMITYASPVLKPDDEFLATLKQQKVLLDRAATLSDIYAVSVDMNHPASRVRDRVAAVVKGEEKIEFDNTYYEFIRLFELMEGHIYDNQALRFNSLLSEFPASMLPAPAVIEPLPLLKDYRDSKS